MREGQIMPLIIPWARATSNIHPKLVLDPLPIPIKAVVGPPAIFNAAEPSDVHNKCFV